MSQAAFEAALALGRRPLASLESPGQAYGQRCLQAARQVLRDGAGLPLLFPHSDLGPTYHLPASNNAGGSRNPPLDAVVVGRRMPHLPLHLHGTTQAAGEEATAVSSTDLGYQWAVMAHYASPPATLLYSPTADGERPTPGQLRAWMHARPLPILPVEVALVDGGRQQQQRCVSLSELGEQQQAALREAGEGGSLRVVAHREAWARAGLSEGEAVLVRPDGHVCAIIQQSALASQPLEPSELVALVLGRRG